VDCGTGKTIYGARTGGYYDDRLAAERLKRCYEIAPPRIRQYLRAEIEHVCERVRDCDWVLDLGCGYGRTLLELARRARRVVGIDTSAASLRMAREMLADVANCRLLRMNAVRMGFCDGAFDVAVCIQNGISAFHEDPRTLIRESLRVTRPGGIVLFSSYAEGFWSDRLEWFRMQAAEGLLGEIDEEKTGGGVIVCKDGFTATTFHPGDFRALTHDLDADARIEEVDGSSLFCEILTRHTNT
jgi:SAM-dependent methyltransferase